MTSPRPSSGPSPEQRLACLCARTHLTPPVRARIERLLGEDLDADGLLEWATWHGVRPLLRRHLPTFDIAPRPILERLEARAKGAAIRTLHHTQELLRVLTRLEVAGIPALPFKGPTLGRLLYDDVALRPFSDLDILVHKGQMAEAEALLRADGYRLYGSLTRAKVRRRLATEKSYELERDGVIVELHWEFLHPMHGFYLDPEAVWSRTGHTEVAGQRLRTLAPDDLVLYLCAHGSKHFWTRLSWVCDVAEALRTYRDVLQWPVLRARAERLHGRRMLLLGCALAHTLLDAPLPPTVAQEADEDEAVQRLIGLAGERLFGNPSAEDEAAYDEARAEARDAQFHLLMRERWRDRLPYYRHLVQLALTPNAKDRALLDLPPRLSFAYYAVRPVRLLRDAAAHGLRAWRER